MRLFVAIELVPEIRETVRRLLGELLCAAPSAKWVRPENLHVTLKFLGESSASQLESLKMVLSEVRLAQPVRLDFRGLGCFPNEKRAKVFWLGMQASSNLEELAGAVDLAAHSLGFALEDRPFTPHLTLARFPAPGMPADLATAVRGRRELEYGSQTTSEFHLIESKLKPSGAEYTTLQTFRFTLEA